MRVQRDRSSLSASFTVACATNTSVNASGADKITIVSGCPKVSLFCVFRRTFGWRENVVILILQGTKETIWTCLLCPPARAHTWPWVSNLALASAAGAVAHQPLFSSPDGWHRAQCFKRWALREAYYMVTNPTLIKTLGNYFSRNTRIIIKES